MMVSAQSLPMGFNLRGWFAPLIRVVVATVDHNTKARPNKLLGLSDAELSARGTNRQAVVAAQFGHLFYS